MKNSTSAIGDLMSVREVAPLKAVAPKTVYGWTYLKRPLPVHRNGRRIFISSADLDAFLNTKRPKSQPPAPEAEVEEDNRPFAPAVRVAIPAAQVTSDLLEQQTSGSGQRELGQRRNAGVPRIAILAGFQFV
ncbi:MAG: helix-turn-helix domain-containing protein [Candidatus Sulfotelmatobacter sp.]